MADSASTAVKAPTQGVRISTVALSASGATTFVFSLAILLQTFHVIEHVVQVYQHALLGLSIKDSHGILFFLDLEWNHMIFNSFYLVLLGAVFLGLGFYKLQGGAREKMIAFLAFNVAFAVQAYHVVEHSIRMVQFFQTGCTPCPGILGSIFDGIYLHAAFNALVYALPVIAFLCYGFHWRMLGEFPSAGGEAPLGRPRPLPYKRGLTIALTTTLIILALRAPTLIVGQAPVVTGPGPILPLERQEPAETFIHIHALITTPERPGFVYVGTHTGLVGGFNRSDFEYDWYYLTPERIEITGLIIDPANPKILYTFGHPTLDEETGIRRTVDRGRTWQLVATRPDPHDWVVSLANSSIMYAVDFPTNVFVRSEDGGTSWRVLSSPGRVYSVAIDPRESMRILAGTDRGLFRSANGGQTWEPVAGPLAELAVTAVAIDPTSPNTAYVGTFFGALKSTNGGVSWSPLPGLVTEDAVRYIAIDPVQSNVVYAASLDKILKSIDGGASWVLIRGPDTR